MSSADSDVADLEGISHARPQCFTFSGRWNISTATASCSVWRRKRFSYDAFTKDEKMRMRLQRLRLELRMELAAEEERMIGNFNDLDVSSVGR